MPASIARTAAVLPGAAFAGPNLQVVFRPLIGVTEHLIGGADLLKSLDDAGGRVDVRMIFARQAVKNLLNLLPRGASIDA
jgi:hypothetical protein